MTELPESLKDINVTEERPKSDVVADVRTSIEQAGYGIAEFDNRRPWGAFVRLDNSEGDTFVEDFFLGLDPKDARLGNPDAELSPKILIVSPNERLSWQYHARRAERWAFINKGGYHRSETDFPSGLILAEAGDVVQFETEERHRLVGAMGHYTLVAEIWQHMDPRQLSDEDDIVRLQDDYKR